MHVYNQLMSFLERLAITLPFMAAVKVDDCPQADVNMRISTAGVSCDAKTIKHIAAGHSFISEIDSKVIARLQRSYRHVGRRDV